MTSPSAVHRPVHSTPESRPAGVGNGSQPHTDDIVKAPFFYYSHIEKHYLFVGLTTEQEFPDMLPDPAFSSLPITIPDLWIWRVKDGPCGPFDWVRKIQPRCSPF
jgi:hypothetical protein